MSNRAKYLGAVGTVIDGRLRDLQEHRLNSEDQDATIHPGDILIGDINGVVCIPQAIAEKALDLISSQVDADNKLAADLQEGRSVAEAMKEHRANVKQP